MHATVSLRSTEKTKEPHFPGDTYTLTLLFALMSVLAVVCAKNSYPSHIMLSVLTVTCLTHGKYRLVI